MAYPLPLLMALPLRKERKNPGLLKSRALIKEATKKVIFLMAVPLRGGGVKALPLRKKSVFGELFCFALLLFKDKNILQMDI